ncbi:MAG: hypothetical protein ACYCQJ_16015 [Nitrososphaerales archaeon]
MVRHGRIASQGNRACPRSKIRSDRSGKPTRKARWYDPADPAIHDLPVRPENWKGDEGQMLSREHFLEDLELDAGVPTKHMIVGGGKGSSDRSEADRDRQSLIRTGAIRWGGWE